MFVDFPELIFTNAHIFRRHLLSLASIAFLKDM